MASLTATVTFNVRMRLYHVPKREEVDGPRFIGFRDGSGYYMTDQFATGVWFSDRPLDENEGTSSAPIVVRVETGDVELDDYEWVEEGKPYREWCIPASIANGFEIVNVDPR